MNTIDQPSAAGLVPAAPIDENLIARLANELFSAGPDGPAPSPGSVPPAQLPAQPSLQPSWQPSYPAAPVAPDPRPYFVTELESPTVAAAKAPAPASAFAWTRSVRCRFDSP